MFKKIKHTILECDYEDYLEVDSFIRMVNDNIDIGSTYEQRIETTEGEFIISGTDYSNELAFISISDIYSVLNNSDSKIMLKHFKDNEFFKSLFDKECISIQDGKIIINDLNFAKLFNYETIEELIKDKKVEIRWYEG